MTTEKHEVLLLGHGTVENLDDVPAFLDNIRRGRKSPPELIREIRHRYELIGGSPLLTISRELARNLEQRLGQKVSLAMRFWHPFAKDVLREISLAGCTSLRVVPLAPFSGHVYGGEMQRLADEQAREGLPPPQLVAAPNWGTEPLLIELFADALGAALAQLPEERRERAHVFFTAHSLPLAVVKSGDKYPDEVAAMAEAVFARAAVTNPHRLVFQSQGASEGGWLGPDVRESIRAAAQDGARDLVFCPIGFLGDHVEILYDLDIEAKGWALEAGLGYHRTASPNASPKLVDALASVVARL